MDNQLDELFRNALAEHETALPENDWLAFKDKLEAARANNARKHPAGWLWVLVPAVAAAVAVMFVKGGPDPLEEVKKPAPDIYELLSQEVQVDIVKPAAPAVKVEIPEKCVDVPDRQYDPPVQEQEKCHSEQLADSSGISQPPLVESNVFETGKKISRVSITIPAAGVLANGAAIAMMAGGNYFASSGSSGLSAENNPAQYGGNLVIGRIEHHYPLVAGVSFRYQLAKKWSVVSGMEYTFYSSEFFDGSHLKAHCLGIPLRLDYRIFESGRFEFFAGLGIKADWGLNMTLDGVQKEQRVCPMMSAIASGVAQFRISPKVSLYLEPTLSIDFGPDNPYILSTYRGSGPLTFTTPVGIRIDL